MLAGQCLFLDYLDFDISFYRGTRSVRYEYLEDRQVQGQTRWQYQLRGETCQVNLKAREVQGQMLWQHQLRGETCKP